jgi:chromosome segregation protein
MRIRRLELVGFKSFITRTRFDFPDGITAIVGPNGCGKSNIVDAIRWVLGEQSPTHLRGKAMEDVIFNGNERTGPLGMAEVSLGLERTGTGPLWGGSDEEAAQDSDLQRQLAGVSEITVTRRYFRSGESEFFINRVPCRLRDITEFFLGSGVGTKAYSTIEQGRVEQLVNAKPETLRLFIEEAAGTTRYRSRKVMAERKLERTRENLARLADVIREIERQVSTLSRQAKRAEEYRRCRDELRALELGAARVRYRAATRQLGEFEAKLRALADRDLRLGEAVELADRGLAEARMAARSVEEHHQRLNVRLVECRLAAEGAAERRAYMGETLGGIDARRQEARAEHEALAKTLHEAVLVGEETERERRALEEKAQKASARHRQLDDELREYLRAAAEGEAAIESAKTILMECLSEQVRLRNLVVGLSRDKDDIARRSDGARQTLARVEEVSEGFRRGLEQAQQRVGALRKDAETTSEICREHGRSLEEARTLEGGAARALEAAREGAGDIRSRLGSLEDLSRRWEGYAAGVGNAAAHAPADTVLGAVADVLRVPKAYETAVAAALGSRLQCLITRSHGEAVQLLETLGSNGGGRASFLPMTLRRPHPEGEGAARRLLDVVEVAEEFRALAESLLANVVLVDSLAEAIPLWQRNGSPSVFVTRDGSVLDALGSVSGGSDPPFEEALLARSREVRELQAALGTAVAAAEEAAAHHRGAAERLERLQATHEQASRKLEVLRVEEARAAKDEERLAGDLSRAALEQEAAQGAMRELASEEAQAAERLELAVRQLAEAEERVRQAEIGLAQWRERLGQARTRVEGARGELTGAAVEEAEHRAARDRAAEVGRQAVERVESVRVRLRGLEDRLVGLDSEADRLIAGIAAVEADRRQKLDELETIEGEVGQGAEQVASSAAEVMRLEQAVGERRQEIEACRRERPAMEVALAEQRASMEHLVESIMEKYGVHLAKEPEVTAEGVDVAEGSAEARIEALRSRLLQIGEVHVGAIEELDELERRREFLTQQRDDLQRSIDDLRRTIGKLNRLSRSRFRETFEEASRSLQNVFPRLFPGGRAQLLLTEPEEGDEPGVEIVVQPAGKKLQSLSLLSGGEKALTAVSLILSLFMIRPTPFCVLDEVDAPLDDMNVGRFDHVIRDISRVSQFVVITHNKRTMEAADTLYGITMEEPGVSRVVSVRLKQAA